MNKKAFMDIVEEAIERKLGIAVRVQIPDLPKEEIIINYYPNVEIKAKYYDKAYNDNMELISNPDISITYISLV